MKKPSKSAVDDAGIESPITIPPPLLDSTVGLNRALIDAITKLTIFLSRYEAEGQRHGAAEVAQDGTPEKEQAWLKADRRFQRILRQYDRLCDAVLDAPALSQIEHNARITAYLRAKALYVLPYSKWSAFTAKEAVEVVAEHAPQAEQDLAPALLTLLDAVQPPPQPVGGLGGLAERFRTNLEAYRAAVREEDIEPESSSRTAIRDATENVQQGLYNEVMAYQPRSLAELATKATLLKLDGWNETAERDNLVADILRLNAQEPAVECPVAVLAPALEAIMDEEVAIEDRTKSERAAELSDARDELVAKAAKLQAASIEGAAMQIGFALEMAELVRGCSNQEDRDHFHTQVESLLTSVVSILGGSLSDHFWQAYVGGPRPQQTPVIANRDPSKAAWMAAKILAEWKEARTRHAVAWAAYESLTDEQVKADEEAGDPIWSAWMDALEAFEAKPPPSVEALAESMRTSMAHSGLMQWVWQDPDCPKTMRDFLDGGDAFGIFAARYYMHVLRLAGINSPALNTPPIAGLFPSFDNDREHEDEAQDMEAAWREHHASAKPYPKREAEFAEWLADRNAVGEA